MKCSILLHSSGSTLFVKVKKIRIQYILKNSNRTPLDMSNGLSQVFLYQTSGMNLLVYKVL